jgi:NAD-dependent protein deacetylase/lipoamidase
MSGEMNGTIVVLTGAGISAESGLATFRDPEGIWARYDIEEVATPEAFARNPALVQEFYNERRRQLRSPDVVPNAAHLALAGLERRWPSGVTVVTQNVDDLHERAGTRRLIHMHGELLKARCARSGRVIEQLGDLRPEDRCGCCGAPGTLRPHVVWFGESPMGMELIEASLLRCDRLLCIGTSGVVYPAAGFASLARHAGARTVEINVETTQVSALFAERILGPATIAVPAYVERLLAGRP